MQRHNKRWHQIAFLTTTWTCQFCEWTPDREVYKRPEDLHSHVAKVHKEDIKEEKRESYVRACRTHEPRAWSECLLCSTEIPEPGPPERIKRKRASPGLDGDEGRENSNKSRRISLDMDHPKPQVELRGGASSDSEMGDSDTSTHTFSSSDMPDEVTPDRSMAMARHIAGHLQTLMLMTLRLGALQEEQDGLPPDSGEEDGPPSCSVNAGDSKSSRLSVLDTCFRPEDYATREDQQEASSYATGDEEGEALRIPDTDFDLNQVPRRYDNADPAEDKLLKALSLSMAHRPQESQ